MLNIQYALSKNLLDTFFIKFIMYFFLRKKLKFKPKADRLFKK